MLSTLTPLEARYVAPDLGSRRAGRGGNPAGSVGLLIQRYWAGPGPGGRYLRLYQLRHLPPLIEGSGDESSQGARHLVEGRRPGWCLAHFFAFRLRRFAATQFRGDTLDAEFEFVQAVRAGDL